MKLYEQSNSFFSFSEHHFYNYWNLVPGDIVINKSETVVCFIYFGFLDHHHRFLTSENKIVSLPTQELTLCNN